MPWWRHHGHHHHGWFGHHHDHHDHHHHDHHCHDHCEHHHHGYVHHNPCNPVHTVPIVYTQHTAPAPPTVVYNVTQPGAQAYQQLPQEHYPSNYGYPSQTPGSYQVQQQHQQQQMYQQQSGPNPSSYSQQAMGQKGVSPPPYPTSNTGPMPGASSGASSANYGFKSGTPTPDDPPPAYPGKPKNNNPFL